MGDMRRIERLYPRAILAGNTGLSIRQYILLAWEAKGGRAEPRPWFAAHPGSRQGHPLPKDYNLERLNFLVIEDNKHMSSLVRSILNAFGVRNVVEAMDGAEAFKVLRHFPADIVICDWMMQPMDGIEFVRMVRTQKDSPNPFVPVIMLTAHTQVARVFEARDAGANEFLAKPISPQKLYDRIRSIIENQRPYIKLRNYFGPDRRRKTSTVYKGPERRKVKVELIEAGPLLGAPAGLK